MQFRAHILAMKPYKPPLAGRHGCPELLLDFNERTTPLPADILEDLAAWCRGGQSIVYPEYDGLEEALGSYCGMPAANIAFGVGSDQILDCVFRAVVDPGDAVSIPSPSFALFRHGAELAGARILEYDLLAGDEGRADLRRILEDRPRLVVLCQPNNPTGQLYPPEEVRGLVRRFPDTWFLVDEAYYEFAGATVLVPGEPLPPNLVVTRTMSKVFGLAALRFGYMAAPEAMVEQVLKIRGPYDVHQLAAVAAARVLRDPGRILAYAREIMDVQKPRVEAALEAAGLAFVPSRANFILVPGAAARLAKPLAEARVRCRIMTNPRLAGSIRLGVGHAAATDRLLAAIAASGRR